MAITKEDLRKKHDIYKHRDQYLLTGTVKREQFIFVKENTISISALLQKVISDLIEQESKNKDKT